MSQLAFPLARPSIDENGMSSDEIRVVRALEWGSEQAKQIEELAEECAMPGRKVQQIVRRLREEHAVPIGSSMGRPFGNYLVDDPEELAKCYALFRARGLSNLTQAAKLKGQSLKRYLEEVQTELPVEAA